MADIDIERKHTFSQAEAREKVKVVEDNLRNRFGVSVQWNSDDEASFKGKGFSGTLRVTNEIVKITVKLGMLLKPLSGKIRQGIESGVDKALA